MIFLKRIFSSTPVVLILGLAVIVCGGFLLLTALFTIVNYIEISLSIGFIVLIIFLILQYIKFRKPHLELYEWTSDSQKDVKEINARLWNEELKLVVSSGFIISIITVANYWYGFIIAPIVLFIDGVFCLVVTYLMDKGRIDYKVQKTDKFETYEASRQTGIPQTLINYSIILALISGFWAFQIQKNESELKQEGYSLTAELSNLSTCKDYQSKCVAVDSVKSVYFKKVKNVDGPGKILQMCFSLNYKYARYGGFYQSDFRYKDYCFNEDMNFGFGWPQYEIEQEITKQLRQEIVRW